MQTCVMSQEFLEAMGSYYYNGKSNLTDAEFDKLREVGQKATTKNPVFK